MIRPAEPADSPALVALAASTGIFLPDEAEGLLGGVLGDLHAGRLGEGHRAEVRVDDQAGPPLGWVYYAPTDRADGVWDLWWIGVDPASQTRGIGGALLGHVEAEVLAAGGRLLIVETSSQPAFDPVRRFYAHRGFADCGTIPDFYAEGDGKVIFAKRLSVPSGASS